MSLKGVLIDISGTLIVGNEAIPKSICALNRLREAKVPLRFISNTTKESKQTLVNRLNNLGLSADSSEVFTSLIAAKQYVKGRNLRPWLMLEEDAKLDFSDLDTENPNAVVVGLAPSNFNYQSMNQAFQLLLNGAKLIGIHKARYFKTYKDLSLGPGPFIAALEHATGCEAAVIGKPQKSFFDEVIAEIATSREGDYFMIGDDVADDIDGAQKAGLKGILVKTGKYRSCDESKIQPKPYAVVDSFYDAVNLLLHDQ